jgi:hypothetical protein
MSGPATLLGVAAARVASLLFFLPSLESCYLGLADVGDCRDSGRRLVMYVPATRYIAPMLPVMMFYTAIAVTGVGTRSTQV